ncbi:MAG: Crp/Fnr family transcriptional regulator [Bacteroidetes bacterium]|nr:Crp/Fnr family transcriptional regulator [Bacteroidota bacterium]
MKKKQLVLAAGNIGQEFFFVRRGLLRLFSTDDKANEHVIHFAPEGWWVADNHSFLLGKPAIFSIEALEDSEILMLSKENVDALSARVPIMERYFRLLMQTGIISLHRRIANAQSQSAEQKYLEMMELYPDIVIRTPQHYIASYLGVTPETLSRIRKKVSSNP